MQSATVGARAQGVAARSGWRLREKVAWNVLDWFWNPPKILWKNVKLEWQICRLCSRTLGSGPPSSSQAEHAHGLLSWMPFNGEQTSCSSSRPCFICHNWVTQLSNNCPLQTCCQKVENGFTDLCRVWLQRQTGSTVVDGRMRALEPARSPVAEAELGEPSHSSHTDIHFSCTPHTLHVYTVLKHTHL